MTPNRRGECVLGLDIGTTGARAVAFDLRGRQLHDAAQDYPLRTPHPGWAEQDPRQVCEAALGCLKQTAEWASSQRLHVAALGISAILHSVIPVDGEGNALEPSLIWADTRSTPQAEAIKGETDPLALYRRVGGPVHPMYLPAKLRWFARERPDSFRRAAHFVGIKEYVLRRWAGLHVCDKSVATGTALYNLRAGDWDEEALQLAGIDASRLPPVIEPTEPLKVPAAALRGVGLPEECVVVAGAGDGVLQTIGTGCVAPGQMVAMVATSGAVRAVVDEPRTDERARTWCYYLAEGRWVAGAAINNAGIVYAWLRDQFRAAAKAAAMGGSASKDAQEVDTALLDRWAAEIPAGSNGLLFLPYLAGERSPNWNANARGLLFGLSLAHDYRHLARATLEGVGFRMRTIFEPMEEVAGPAREVRAAGGFIRSPLWTQIVADVLGQPLLLADSPDASALGAAQLALRGAGIVKRFEDLAALANSGDTIQPHREHHALYTRLYDLYQRLYAHASADFAAIAALQAELAQ